MRAFSLLHSTIFFLTPWVSPIVTDGVWNIFHSILVVIHNMDTSPENIELFKRKHITQNREIIKANAVAQLRIRELENRVQVLEAEKVQKELAASGLTAQVSNLHHAISHTGWDASGRCLTLSTAFSQSELPPSNQAKVEPNLDTVGIVRPVAIAPEAHSKCLQEEPESQKFIEHTDPSLSASSPGAVPG